MAQQKEKTISLSMVEHRRPEKVVFSELEAILVYTGIPDQPGLHSQTLSKEGRRKKKRREQGRKKEKKKNQLFFNISLTVQ